MVRCPHCATWCEYVNGICWNCGCILSERPQP